jgi:hypothetical protein
VPTVDPKVVEVPHPSASLSTEEIERRRAEIAAEIAALGPALPGSLAERHTRCAKRTCRCRADPPQLHGPYLVWTRTEGGKSVTRSLTAEQAARLQPWIDNARRLRELVAELHQLAVQQAEQAEGWPRT